jgi:penicillin-binding protein 1A
MANRVNRATAGARPTVRSNVRRAVPKSSPKKRLKTFLALLLLALESAAAFGLIFGLVIFWQFTQEMPSLESLVTEIRPPRPTRFFSEDGVLLAELQVENREPIPLSEMPAHLTKATVAIEDHRFFEHPGVDAQGIIRAAWLNVTKQGRFAQGGSTLTQQLTRNLRHLGVGSEKRLERKIREAFIALRLEQVYSKNEILELYLNNVPYGAGAYGVQAASKTFFGKPASKLTLAEAALISGLAQRPSYYNPFRNLKAALKRRDLVLDNMQKYGMITQTECARAKKEVPRILPQRRAVRRDSKAPHFVEYVYTSLKRQYGEEFVKSGLTIHTTLNWKMQQWAEEALKKGLERAEARRGSAGSPNQGALISIDNRTGYIRAMVGSRDYKKKNFNYVTMGARQPGSTFKVFDYAAAFDQDAAELYSAFPDRPIPYPNDRRKIVKNYDGRYSYGSISCFSAIQWSKNTIAVQVARKVGIDSVVDYAKKMGITTNLRRVLPTALGASEVRPLDLAVAYSVFPMKGSRCVPMGIVKILDADDNLLDEYQPKKKLNILKPQTAEWMDKALEAVVTSGTGTRARGNSETGIVEGARGKTGTTNDNRDAWFAGYTPELTTVVWVAREITQRNGSLIYARIPGGTGGELCAPIWHDFMVKAVPEQRKFKPIIEGIQVDVNAPDDRPEQPKRRRNETNANPPQTEPEADIPPETEEEATEPTPARPQPVEPEPERETPAVAPPTTTPETSLTAAEQPLIRRSATPLPTNTPARTSTPTLSSTRSVAPEMPTRTTPPLNNTPPPPEMVSLRVCVDSNQLATDYCPASRNIKVTTRQKARLVRCREHKPPPGEGN